MAAKPVALDLACRCGHDFGVHYAEKPHDCSRCDCEKFVPRDKREVPDGK